MLFSRRNAETASPRAEDSLPPISNYLTFCQTEYIRTNPVVESEHSEINLEAYLFHIGLLIERAVVAQ